jgi:hypothetical protein
MGNSKTRSKLDAKSDRARAGSLSADSDQWNWPGLFNALSERGSAGGAVKDVFPLSERSLV